MRTQAFMHGIGSGRLLRLDHRLHAATALRDSVDWLRSGGRVLLRDPGRVAFAEAVRRSFAASGDDRSLMAVIGERSIVLTLTVAGDDADTPGN